MHARDAALGRIPADQPDGARIFEGRLWLGGMPNTLKFRDLSRDPRFSLHTATIDTHVSDGDAKLWGVVHNVQDPALHQRYAQWLFQETRFDLRGQTLTDFYAADLAGASSVEVDGGHLDIRIWRSGEPERVVRKH